MSKCAECLTALAGRPHGNAYIHVQEGEPFASLRTEEVARAVSELTGNGVMPHLFGNYQGAYPAAAKGRWRVPIEHGRWHIDGPGKFSLRDIRKGVWFVLFTDVESGRGPTVVLKGSHVMVARTLSKLGRLSKFEMKSFCEAVALVLDHTAVPLLGRAGDVYFAHPLLVHSPSNNMGDTPRWITNTGMKGESTVSLESDLSPIGRAIAPAVERTNFRTRLFMKISIALLVACRMARLLLGNWRRLWRNPQRVGRIRLAGFWIATWIARRIIRPWVPDHRSRLPGRYQA